MPGPWDEGYVGPAEAYFSKGGRSFGVRLRGVPGDTTPRVRALAERLAEGV